MRVSHIVTVLKNGSLLCLNQIIKIVLLVAGHYIKSIGSWSVGILQKLNHCAGILSLKKELDNHIEILQYVKENFVEYL